MLPLLGSLLGTLRLRPRAGAESCPICHRPIGSDDERVHLPRGGHVHRGCATYRMRQHERTVRRLGSI
jgi:hypothetical protein